MEKVSVFRIRDRRVIRINADSAGNVNFMKKMGLAHIEEPESPEAMPTAPPPVSFEPAPQDMSEPWDLVPASEPKITRDMAREMYRDVFGKNPHATMKIEAILAKIKESQN